MYCKLIFATLAVLIGNEFVHAQQIPSTTTAAELWNPWTWFWPYAIASSEAYRDYYAKAQKATNELYQQIYKTNAFPWVTGNWGMPQVNPAGGSGQNNPVGGAGSNTTGGSTGSGQNSPTDSTGGSGGSGQSSPTGSSGQSSPTGGSGSDATGQSSPTGSSGGSDQNSTSSGSPEAQVQANA